MKKEELMELYKKFFSQHIYLISQNILLEISIPILEISFYRILTKEIISKLQVKSVIKTIKSVKKYLLFLIGLQILQFYNKYLINRLLPFFQIYIRKNLMKSLCVEDYKKIQKDSNNNLNEKNTILTINLNQMPLALYYAYDSLVKFIIPLISILGYIIISIYNISVNYSVITILYFIFNVIMIYYNIINYSKEYRELYRSHSILVSEYNQCFRRKYEKYKANEDFFFSEEDESCLKEKEMKWEKERFHLNLKINSFILLMVISFYIFSVILIYFFMKKNPDKLEKIILLLIFSSRYYITILYRTYLTVNSFGKLLDFQDTMLKLK